MMTSFKNVIAASALATVGLAAVFAVIYLLLPAILFAPVVFGAFMVLVSGAALLRLLRKDRYDRLLRQGKAVRTRERPGVHHV